MVIAIRQNLYFSKNPAIVIPSDYIFSGKFKDFDEAIEKLELTNLKVELENEYSKNIYKRNVESDNGYRTDYYYTLIELDKTTEDTLLGLTFDGYLD